MSPMNNDYWVRLPREILSVAHQRRRENLASTGRFLYTVVSGQLAYWTPKGPDRDR